MASFGLCACAIRTYRCVHFLYAHSEFFLLPNLFLVSSLKIIFFFIWKLAALPVLHSEGDDTSSGGHVRQPNTGSYGHPIGRSMTGRYRQLRAAKPAPQLTPAPAVYE